MRGCFWCEWGEGWSRSFALERVVDEYRVKTDKDSAIVNDPNPWFAENPAELVAHLERLVHVGVETTSIVEGLSPALVD